MHSATQFLSTPSARRATHQTGGRLCSKSISIHALREEGDVDSSSNVYGWVDISIHALREEGDFASMRCAVRASNFYPRPPRGGRLFGRWSSLRKWRNFYPRPPRGGRPAPTSISDPERRFLSTPSARRATAKTETKSLFSNKLYNILHEFRRALIYNGSKSYPNHAK